MNEFKKIIKHGLALLMILLLGSSLLTAQTLKLGSRDDKNHSFLIQILGQYLIKKGRSIEIVEPIPRDQLYFELKNKAIDGYFEYLHVGNRVFAADSTNQSNQDGSSQHFLIAQAALNDGIRWGSPNNLDFSRSVLVTRKNAETKKWHSVQDFLDYCGQQKETCLLGVDGTFSASNNGLIGLTKNYKTNLERKQITRLPMNQLWDSLHQEKITGAVLWGVDANLQRFDLISLIDDRKYFMDYRLCWLMRLDTQQGDPELIKLVQNFEQSINSRELSNMLAKMTARLETREQIIQSWVAALP